METQILTETLKERRNGKMNYVVWGCGKIGKWSKEKIELLNNANEKVVAYADNDLSKIGMEHDGIPVISVWKLKRDFKDCTVCIPTAYGEKVVRKIFTMLEDTFLEGQIKVIPYNTTKKEGIEWEELLCPLESWHQFDTLDLMLAKHCNLRCVRCNAFSNIAEEAFYLPERLEKDLKRLSIMVPNIKVIKLIGGEPLLNPDLTECIKISKKYYPYARVSIVTNGLLIRKLDAEKIKTIKENDVGISMTLYPALHNSIDDIVDCLREQGIRFNIFRSGDYFVPILNETGKYNPNDIKKQEDKVKCIVMFNGKISRCAPGLNIDVYNKKYGKNFPADGIYNIHDDEMNGERLVKHLDDSFELCRFCNGCYNLNELQYGEPWGINSAKWDDWLEKW